MADAVKQENKKYQLEPIDNDKIVRRECPSGLVAEYYPVGNRFVQLSFMESGFTPDPRTHVSAVQKMHVFPDDIIICAYPKSGTHWVYEMTKMLLKGEAEYDPSPKEVAMLEFHSLDIFDGMSRPRVLNSHNPVSEIPRGYIDGKGKVIFVQRNPKDIVVSFYNHMINMHAAFPGTWEDFVYFAVKYGGYFSDWFQYTLDFDEELKRNTEMKCLNIYYEDIKKNPVVAVKSLAKYLEVPCSDKLSEEIADKCSFSNMKIANKTIKFDHVNNSKPNPEFKNQDAMYRKGEVGDWKNWFTDVQREEFDQVFQEKMKNCSFAQKLSD